MTKHSCKELEKAPLPSGLEFDYIEDRDVLAYLHSIIQKAWRSDKERVVRKDLSVFIRKIVKAEKHGKDIVLFIAVNQGSCPSIEYVAKGLGEQENRYVSGIYLRSEPPIGVYDNAVSCKGSLWMLAELICRIPVKTIYLQAHARWSFLSQFIKAIKPDIFVIQEVYDWMGAYIGDKRIFINEGVFSEAEIRLMQESEQYIRNNNYAFIYKDGGKWMRQIIETSKAHSLQILPCPPIKWMIKPLLRNAAKRTRLVFAGQVATNKSSMRFFGDTDYLPIFRDLTCQNLSVTVFNNVFYSKVFPDEYYSEYIQEAEKNMFFEFRTGLPMPEIIDKISGQYDYGLIISNIQQDLVVGKDHINGTISSKLFTYIASGIPVIVSKEFEYMSEFVAENGIGIVVAQDEISHLGEILAAADYDQMISNVIKTQQSYNIERYIPQICDLLDNQ